MNKSALTLGPFETKPVEDNPDLCEIGAFATDGETEKYFGIIIERGENALHVGHAFVRAIFEEFRDHETMMERCECGATRERGFGNEEYFLKEPCMMCRQIGKYAFDPRPRNRRAIHWDSQPREPVK